MSKVVVQLLAWNGAKHLPRVLASLARQTFKDFELLVLDNASTDGSVALVEAALATWPRPTRLIKAEKNFGFSGGHNRLFALTDSAYVFCVNQDVVLEDDYLERLVEFLDAHPDAGAASGVLRHEDGSVDTAGLKKNWYARVCDLMQPPREPVTRVFGVSGALPVYRRAAVLEVSPDGKLFDENFFAYKEDVDLAWRLNRFGWSAFTVAAARAIHERGFGESKKWQAAHYAKQQLSSRNHLLMLVKDLPAADWWCLPAIVFYELGKLAYTAIFVPKATVYVGEFFRLLPEMRKIRKVVADKLKARERHG